MIRKLLSSLAAAAMLLPAVVFGQEDFVPKQDESGKYGYYRADTWVIPARYDKAYSFSDGLAAVKLNGKFGFITRTGEAAIAYRFDNAWSFSEGLACVKLNGKWGFVRHDGSAAIAYRFDDAKSFSEGLAAVKANGKWGFIDRDGVCTIPYKYDSANSFSEGLAAAQLNGKWGFIDSGGKWYATKEDYIPPFSDYAKRYVEREINKWQVKGKYEKTVDWQQRVNERTRKDKVTELTHQAEKEYILEQGNAINISQRLDDYDADNEIFLVKDDNFGDLLVPVPIADAPAFDRDFYTMKRSVRYFVENDRLALAELTFTTSEGKNFTYSNAASLEYFITNVDYRFAPIEIDESVVTRMQRGEQRIKYAQLDNAAQSDVDVNIPKTNVVNDHTFAVIIANELYKHEEQVPYAKTDGESFRNYCMRTLGLPEGCVHFCADATLNEMRMAMNWLKDIGEAFGSEAKVLFYYAGHGVSDDATRSAVLLPVDGSGRDTESGYSVDKLYSQLGALPVGSVTVFLDACFSGSKRDGEMMVASRGVAIKPKASTPVQGNMVILSATTGDETAALYPAKGHGLFTYFLLKKLQETQGKCTLGELADYVTKRVNQESVIANKRPQTPTVSFSPAMTDRWAKLMLR